MHKRWASWVRSQRKAAKLTLSELALRCECDPSLITLIERDGHIPRRPVAAKIGEAFGAQELALVRAGYVPHRLIETLAQMVAP